MIVILNHLIIQLSNHHIPITALTAVLMTQSTNTKNVAATVARPSTIMVETVVSLRLGQVTLSIS